MTWAKFPLSGCRNVAIGLHSIRCRLEILHQRRQLEVLRLLVLLNSQLEVPLRYSQPEVLLECFLFRPRVPLGCSPWARDVFVTSVGRCDRSRWGLRNPENARRRIQNGVISHRAGTPEPSSSSSLPLPVRTSSCSSEPKDAKKAKTWSHRNVCGLLADCVFRTHWNAVIEACEWAICFVSLSLSTWRVRKLLRMKMIKFLTRLIRHRKRNDAH